MRLSPDNETEVAPQITDCSPHSHLSQSPSYLSHFPPVTSASPHSCLSQSPKSPPLLPTSHLSHAHLSPLPVLTGYLPHFPPVTSPVPTSHLSQFPLSPLPVPQSPVSFPTVTSPSPHQLPSSLPTCHLAQFPLSPLPFPTSHLFWHPAVSSVSCQSLLIVW
jgi:hypothetical protein